MDDDAELDMWCYHETENAYLVGETKEEGEDGEKYWLAKKNVRERSEPRTDGSRTYTVAGWWAEKEGLI